MTECDFDSKKADLLESIKQGLREVKQYKDGEIECASMPLKVKVRQDAK